jgi:outer membrane protein TolC
MKKLLILVWVLGINLLDAQNKMSLQQCIDYALKNHPNVTKAELEKQIGKYQVRETIGKGLPQLNADLDVRHFVELPTSLIPAQIFGGPPGSFIPVQFGTKNNAQANLQLSQLIFDGQYFVGIESSKMYYQLLDKQLLKTKEDLAGTVAKAYYASIINQKRLDILKSNLAQLDSTLQILTALKNNGMTEPIEVDRVRVSYNNLKTELDKAQKLVDLSLNLLKFQMGMDLNQTLELETHNLEQTISQVIYEPVSANSSKRIEFELLQQQIALQKKNIQRYRFARLPGIYGYATLSTQAQRNEFNFWDTKKQWFGFGLVGFQIKVPLFDGLVTQNRIQAEKNRLYIYEQDLRLFKQSVDFEIKNAETQFINAKTTLEIQKRNMDLAQEVFRVTQQKYQKGIGSNLELVQAQTALEQAQINYYNALLEAYAAYVDLKKATGEILSTFYQK